MSGTRTVALAAALALVAGCSLLQPKPAENPDAPGDRAAADTAAGPAAAATDTARADTAGGDPGRPAADSTLRALRDSARAMRERRGHRADSARGERERRPAADSADRYPHGPVTVTSVDSLETLGPVYTPYDRGPVMRTGDYLDGLLRAALVPVIRDLDLSPETWARFWVLVGPEGRVRATDMHLGSGHAAFDAAAHAVAQRLRYLPAERDGEPVPVWVLARISLLMG